MPTAAPARLTVAEVARHLRLGTRKVYDLVARKGLPHTRAGGKLLFDVAEVERWLAQSAGRLGAAPRASPADARRQPRPAPRLGGARVALRARAPHAGQRRRAGAARARGSLGRAHAPALGGPLRLQPRGGRASGCAAGTSRSSSGRGASRASSWRAAIRRRSARWPTWRSRASRWPRGRRGREARCCWSGCSPARASTAERLRIGATTMGETDLAMAVKSGEADVGLGARAAAAPLGLDFVPLVVERLDLGVSRAAWFEPPLRALFAFARASASPSTPARWAATTSPGSAPSPGTTPTECGDVFCGRFANRPH